MAKPPDDNEFPAVSWSESPEPADSSDIEGPGQKIGRYKLLRLIGEGGMGLVYMAEQKSPVKRFVALKIIKPGMDTKQVIARFEAERQVLALLDHPNIAHVIDAGTTKSGRPYFVMEYIKGLSITEYCDKHKLNIEQRLKLFLQVCDAVQYAHQKGIIHRDIKPSNILVTVQSDRATPKIIDFGIAKALTQQLTKGTLYTQHGELLGTPEYMSPEQVDIVTEDIDTRSDVYSLGVLLYVLLTGVLPFDRKSLEEKGFAELKRTIREEEPARPSTKLSRMGDEAKKIAEKRKTQIVSLSKCLHRELEWIPLKAMRKEPARRYRSVSELADDINNYLNDAPLIAGPETAMYRVRKFVHKHAGSVFTVLLVAAVIVLGLIVSTTMYFRAENARKNEVIERSRAEQAEEIAQQQRKVAENQRKLAEESAEGYRREQYVNTIQLADAKYREGNIGYVRKLLESCPKDLRGWEWDRLKHVSDQSLTTLRGHKGDAWSVVFSPNGQMIASCSDDNTIRIWDAVTHGEMMILVGHDDYINSIAFSSDSKQIVSGSADRTIRMWDVASGQELMNLHGHDGSIRSVAFSPDGKRIASVGGTDRTVKVWDATSGKELMILQGHSEYIQSIAFSPDGNRIASMSNDNTIKLWDATNGNVSATVHLNEYSSCMAFSPDGRYIILAGLTGNARILDATSGNELITIRGHKGRILSVAFSPDSKRVVSGGYDNTVRIWDAETGAELMVLRGHENGVFCVGFSPNGSQIVSSGGDKTIKLWDAYIDYSKMLLQGHRDYVTGLVFTPDEKQIVSSSGRDGTIRIWDVASGIEVRTFYIHEREGYYPIALSPDGKLIASGAWDKTIRLTDLMSGKRLSSFQGHQGYISSVTFDPSNKRLVSGSYDMTVRVWDIETGDNLMTLRGHNMPVRCVAVSPDSKLIVSGGLNWRIKIWDMATGKNIRTLHGHEQTPVYVDFSADGKHIISCGADNTIRVWMATTGEELMTLKGHSNTVTFAGFSQDGKRIISSSRDNTARVWDTESGQELMSISGNVPFISSALSQDNQTLAVGQADGNIVLWQSNVSPEWRRLRQITGRARAVVDRLYSEYGVYGVVTEQLISGTILTEPVRQAALQIAKARRWEDIHKLNKESWEVISSPNEDLDRYDTALHKAKKAYNLDPNNWTVLNALGIAQYRMSLYKDALETLTRVKKMMSDNDAESLPVNLAFIAMVFHKLNRPEDARTTMRQLHGLFEHSEYDNDDQIRDFLIEAETLLAGQNSKLATIWEDIKLAKLDDGARVIGEMLSTNDPQISEQIKGAVKWLGRAYYRRGKQRLNIGSEYAGKIANYEKAVRIDPNFAPALNDLAWLRATCPANEHRSVEQAVELAERACEITDWRDHEYISTLAAAYSELGDFDTAIKWQNRAAGMLPVDCPPELRTNYGTRFKVYESHKPYRKGSLWSFSDGELVAHWKFDDIEGGKVIDSSKNGIKGTLIGDAHIIVDQERGSVLSLDGKGDYVDCGHSPAFNISGSITVSVWIKTRIPQRGQLIGSNVWWLFCDYEEQDETSFGGTFMGDAMWYRWISTLGSAINDGKWHNVVGVYDGIRICSYMDGILDDHQHFEGYFATFNEPIYIGGSPQPEAQLNALIDDVRIYSYALSAEEVKMLYEGKEPPREKMSD